MKKPSQFFDPRQVMHSNTIEVFHYKGLLPVDVDVHHHDFYEVYMFLKGNAEYWIEGRRYVMAPGDFMLINPTELHRIIVSPDSTEYERIVLWINKDYVKSLSTENTDLTKCFDMSRPGSVNIIHPIGSALSPLSRKITELADEYTESLWGNDIALEAIFLQFMIELNRNSDISSHKTTKESEGSIVFNVLKYINENFNENLTLDKLSERFFVSKYHLSHTFRKEVGVSLYRYVILKRLLSAKELLLRGIAAGEVAYLCGFGDYAGFWRAFKTEYGISPKEFVLSE